MKTYISSLSKESILTGLYKKFPNFQLNTVHAENEFSIQ